MGRWCMCREEGLTLTGDMQSHVSRSQGHYDNHAPSSLDCTIMYTISSYTTYIARYTNTQPVSLAVLYSWMLTVERVAIRALTLSLSIIN